MADDNTARYRSNDSFGRGPAAPATDPLAELARLIGRNDPFSEYGRDARPAALPAAPAPDLGARFDPNLPAQPFHGEPVQPYAPEPAAYEPAPHYSPEPAPPYGHDPAPRYAADYPPRSYDDQAGPNDWPVPAPPPIPAALSYPPNDPLARPPQQPFLPPPPVFPAGPSFGGQPFDPKARPARDGFQPDLPGFDVPPHAPAYAPAHAAAPDPQNYPPLYPDEPDAGGMPPPHHDEFYDDEPRGGRRKGLLTVVAVLGLAVLGTAGAFGYRSMFGGPHASGPVPVIRASGEPSRVAPPPATAEQTTSKFSYDRFGDAGKDEQVVRREEKPVDLSKVQPAPARTVLPGAPVPSPPSTKPGGGPAPSASNPPSAIGEPRRVRTVPIRPDQGGDVAAAAPSQQPMSVTPPRQSNPAPAPSASAPDDTPAARAAAARASSRVALRSPPPAAAPAPAGNAPLSLSPDANNAPPPAAQEAFPPPPQPRASAPPPPARIAAAPPAAAAAPVASTGGSYLVQVSSQRSEAEAESAYRGIQSKFGSVLGGQPHTVRRADLGAKGVYYRAMVGPFASREEAVQVCSSLKQAGGECVVQH